jgi:hypothetical protein
MADTPKYIKELGFRVEYDVEPLKDLGKLEKRLNEISDQSPRVFVGADEGGFWAVLIHRVTIDELKEGDNG